MISLKCHHLPYAILLCLDLFLDILFYSIGLINILLSIDVHKHANFKYSSFCCFLISFNLATTLPRSNAILFQIIPGYPTCFYFHMNFRVSFFNFSKHSAGIFIESTLNE